jgi:anhydro-N-acetylmuramic acid kinase
VIADFRSRDVAAGGQGAPLVPAFHQACSASRDRRVVANIGGIANISVLAGDGSVIGFDTGPGNVLMDGWMHRHKARSTMPTAPGRPAASAAGSAGGTAREPYLALPAPKSTGRDLFHLDWLDARLAVHAPAPPEDVQRTLTHYTAVTLADAIKAYGGGADAVYICGGGAYNSVLMDALARSWASRYWSPPRKRWASRPTAEALAFAWLGYRFSERRRATCRP